MSCMPVYPRPDASDRAGEDRDMNPDRRLLLNAGAALGAAALMGDALAQPSADYLGMPEPGKPGDFDFLQGSWKIKHQRLLKPGEWDRFEGEATGWSILGGVA